MVHDTLSLVCGAIGGGLVLLSAFASAAVVAPALTDPKKNAVPTVFADKDGVSTEELTSKFSTWLPKTCISLCVLAGLGVSTALAVLGSLSSSHDFFIQDWINVGSWALVLVQDVFVVISRYPTRTFTLGVQATISCFLLFVVLGLQESSLVLSGKIELVGPSAPGILRPLQLLLVILTGFANVCIPRRPAVFVDGKPVDASHTDSALSRYTFTWCASMLTLARTKGTLDLKDFPRPDHYTRSKDVIETWTRANRKQRLWIQIFLAHKYEFISQWILTLIQSFGNVAPQFMLLHILRILEERDAGKEVTSEAWIWVIGLGLSSAAAAWIEAWLFWISQSEIAIPVRSELSGLIFRKSMLRKDVKGDTNETKAVPDDKADDGVDAPNVELEAGPGETATPEAEEKKEEAKDEKSSQSTINLIGVDAKRVADFCTFNNYFPGSLFKLVVSFWLLINIIGWKALGLGLCSMLLIVPLNIYYSKKYSATQTALMEIRDKKEAKVSEALKGVRQIKFSALETRWGQTIHAIREQELKILWNVFKFDTGKSAIALLMFCWIASPIILSATSLAVYSVFSPLTPSVAFASIGIFNSLQVTLAVIPELTTDLIDAWISIKRIEDYLNAPEIDPAAVTTSSSISFEDATFSFPSDAVMNEDDERFTLRNVTVSFPDQELSVIAGKTGSGKSLMLAAVLNEVDVLGGTINAPRTLSQEERRDDKATKANWIQPSSIAYVAQIPWIENATIKDNILFGLPCDDDRYNKTVEACALRKDLDMLSDGEMTEIGANGINLSGGQKWRLSFARALYSRAGVLVLDDIFSAVDAHVGRHLFEKALIGELGLGRTRILVTHHVALVKSETKYLVELGDGTVQSCGLLSELEADGSLSKIISHQESPSQVAEDEEATAVNSEESSDDGEMGEALKKVASKASVKKFTEEETKEKGGIQGRLYLDYLKTSGGIPFWTFAVILFLSQQSLNIGRSWWLRLWTESNEEIAGDRALTMLVQSPVSSGRMHANVADDSLRYYLGIYVLIALASSVVSTSTFIYVFSGSIKASRGLFTRLLHTVLRAPLRWHDTVPLGRILNRFTADFNIIDSRVAYDISFFSRAFLSLIGIVLAGLFVSFWVIILAVVLASICIYIGFMYLAAARETKRIESIAKSPIFSQFGSSLSGIGTIRAFGKSDYYIGRMNGLVDDHAVSTWHLWLFNRWMGWRMSMLGGLFSAIVGAFIISVHGLDASLSGFAMYFALEYTGAITWTVRHYANLELDMNAAERVVEYCNMGTESQAGNDPPAAWPMEGRIEVDDLSVAYAPDLPCVLKNLTFSIGRNERVGVVGRTGAGKSSMTLALFRFLEAQTGSIYIDGLDISKIKLETLRSRLAIIPQDPVLFSGTVRSNLDPFGERSDAELTDALKRVHLLSSELSGTATPIASSSDTVTAPDDQNKNIFKDLQSAISPSGLNLSQGQRQLLCLARAIVSRPKVMVLDEATSSVDIQTDEKIQRSIREEFSESTLLVIAHRLSTIADFDQILVLDAGTVAEFGTPKELMQRPDGSFKSMVADSGEKEKLEKLISAS